MPLSTGGNLDINTNGDVNILDAGRDVTQTIQKTLDIEHLKSIFQEQQLLEEYAEKIDALDTALKNKELDKSSKLIEFLVGVGKSAATRWLATCLIKLV